jgi:hypothetical protein
MHPRAVALSLLGCAAVTLGAAWLFKLSLERAILLAPAFVIGSAVIAAVLLLLGRAAVESIRESGHPRLIGAVIIGGLVVVTALAVLGVELPRE